MIGILDLNDYSEMELKQALNSWIVRQKPVCNYRPDHNYNETQQLGDAEYAFAMGQFFAEAHKRGLKLTSVDLLDVDQTIHFIEGDYPLKEDESGHRYIQMPETDEPVNVSSLFI